MKRIPIRDYKGGLVWDLALADLAPGFEPLDIMDSLVRVLTVYESLGGNLEAHPMDLVQRGRVVLRFTLDDVGALCVDCPEPGEVVEPTPLPPGAMHHLIPPRRPPRRR